MQYEFTQRELNIIQEALKNLLEIGITEPQENYLRNIDDGMTEEEANALYKEENKEYWIQILKSGKNPVYNLYFRIFGLS